MAGPICISGVLNLVKRQIEMKLLEVWTYYFKLLQNCELKMTNRPYLKTHFWAHDSYVKVFLKCCNAPVGCSKMLGELGLEMLICVLKKFVVTLWIKI